MLKIYETKNAFYSNLLFNIRIENVEDGFSIRDIREELYEKVTLVHSRLGTLHFLNIDDFAKATVLFTISTEKEVNHFKSEFISWYMKEGKDLPANKVVDKLLSKRYGRTV